MTGTGNRLLSDGQFNYTYDNEGNMLTKTEIATGNVTEYAWDYRNRLTSVTLKNSGGTVLKQSQYTYDPFDKRIGVSDDPDGPGGQQPVVRWTAYDGVNPYADFNGSGSLTYRYLYGPAVDMIMARLSSSGATAWYLTDHLGSVRDLANPSGQVIDHVKYDSFGRVLYESQPTNGDRFKFTAREFDSATGLYYYRARYYDAAIGRFISEDPIGFKSGDHNVYRYVMNRATIATDPSGRNALLDYYVSQIYRSLSTGEKSVAARWAWEMYNEIIKAGDWLEPLAAALMRNWFFARDKGQADPYIINNYVKQAITDKSDGPYKMLERVFAPLANQPFTSGQLDSSWIRVNATKGEIHHALGGFEVRFYGRWSRSGGKLRMTGTWHIRDVYSWKPGWVANVAGTQIPDDYALLVEKYYGARSFRVVGSWYGTIEFDVPAGGGPQRQSALGPAPSVSNRRRTSGGFSPLHSRESRCNTH